jgi:DNA-directed RNA polymerase specialized sigma24 family protein
LIPALAEPQEEDEARRALALIHQLESDSPTGSPSVTSVFRLYCVEELTIEQIAKKCRCSLGTVANRLKLIKAKTGIEPKNLRRVSDHLDRMQADLEAAKKEWRRGRNF